MMRNATIVVGLCILVGMTGCQRFSGSRQYAAPLPATPTTPVGQGDLQPLDGSVPGGPYGDTATGTDVAANTISEPTGAIEVSRSDMLGGWKLSSGGDNCMAFMTLTTWSGGYRANTRGCSSPLLSGISAWDLSGKQVVLKDGSGQTVAQLYATTAQQFNGQTAQGVPASLYR
ncbi:protease inhibitor Inh/omp19 family protein [uncultured Roseibium sp.]|uniref:protease inhibitor Inh/omp19 family protein n=1 Tax=uncultured Roseibium sp. TaxID=1936171 RepID=UPI0032171D32